MDDPVDVVGKDVDPVWVGKAECEGVRDGCRAVRKSQVFLAIHLVLVGPALAEPANRGWTQWRGAAQDGSARESEVFSRPFELRLAWSRELGSGYSGISIVGGKVVKMFSDGETDSVVALDAETGRELWRTELGPTYKGRHGSEDGPSSTPAIADSRVFAVGPAGRLVALDLASGELVWEVDLVESHEVQVPEYGFGASPVPIGDVVYVSAFGNGLAGFAFAREDGRLRWTVGGNWLAYQSAVEDPGRRGLLVSDVSDVALVDPANGEEAFRFTRETRGDLNHPQLVPIGPDKLLLTYDTHIELHQIQPGADPPVRQVWRSRELKDAYSPPVVEGSTIYGLSGVFLVAVDAETGKRRWKSREPGARGLILVDGHLVLLSSDGDVVVVAADEDGYREKARLRVAERGGFTPPSFAGERILVRNTSEISAIEVGVRRDAALAGARGLALAGEDGILPPPGPFRTFLERVAVAEDAARLIDEWWAEQVSFPLVENDSLVHFVYRGEAEDVALIGDMARDINTPATLYRVGATDLYYRSYKYERGGLWKYLYLVDYERAIADPANPRITYGSPQKHRVAFGLEVPSHYSVLAMPGWRAPAFLAASSGGGRLETVPFESKTAYRKRDLTVYLPAGYDPATGGYPVLYVLGAAPWLEHAGLRNALDHLMGSLTEPAIAVLVPYHKGSLDRIGADSYAALLLDEIVPLIDERYPTRAPGVLLASEEDATAAVAAALRAPEKFARIALHSPRIKPDELEKMGSPTAGPVTAYVEWSRFAPRVQDENLDYDATARSLVTLLEGSGTAVVSETTVEGPGWLSWSTRLDRALGVLLPPGP